MKKFFYGNWKMAQSLEGAMSFLKQWKKSDHEIGIFPSFIHANQVLEKAKGLSLRIGVQDISTEAKGAFTGEISAAQVKELGLEMVLIGHSERRQRVPETAQTLTTKFKRAREVGLSVMYCIGESEEERVQGVTLKALQSQLTLLSGDSGELLIAYEPIWAIGTGRTPKNEEIEEVHAFLKEKVPQARAILYGGSVKPENAGAILALKGVDGFLVGGASLKAEDFYRIVKAG